MALATMFFGCPGVAGVSRGGGVAGISALEQAREFAERGRWVAETVSATTAVVEFRSVQQTMTVAQISEDAVSAG